MERLITILALAFFSPVLSGMEIYRIVGRACSHTTGFIVDADGASVSMLSVEGRLTKIPHQDIESILVYNTVTNPVPSVQMDGDLAALVRNVYLGEYQDTPSLVGWPTQFVGELIVFFDLQGKMNLVDQDKLMGIRPPETLPSGRVKVGNARPMAFGFGNFLPRCQDGVTSGKVQPTRIISDKIRINEFFTRFESGFRSLGRFQNRTKYYARPFLYQKDSVIGFNITRENFSQELSMGALPMYYKFASGRPYSHQSMSAIGQRAIEWLPNVEPVFGASSDVKVHFFNASLAGNLFALPAGKSFMTANKPSFATYFGRLGADEISVVTSFNYLAISGIDYGPHSVAFGVIYPIFGFYGDGFFREVLASSSSFVTRYMYTSPRTRYRIIGSATDLGGQSPDETEVKVALSSEMVSGVPLQPTTPYVASMSSYSLKAHYIRAGIDYEASKKVTLGLDQLYLAGVYKELLFSKARRYKFTKFVTALYANQRFGGYVALQGNVNAFHQTYDQQVSGSSVHQSKLKYSGSVSIEFML